MKANLSIGCDKLDQNKEKRAQITVTTSNQNKKVYVSELFYVVLQK